MRTSDVTAAASPPPSPASSSMSSASPPASTTFDETGFAFAHTTRSTITDAGTPGTPSSGPDWLTIAGAVGLAVTLGAFYGFAV